jgi:DNA-binding SARP family transcriptional activator
VEFRILGPLEVVGDDGPVAFHRGKEQALLTYMLLHANQLLPSERLIDELWDEHPPTTAPKILQNAVSQLRKALGPGRIETRPPGYVFHLADGELDVERFERLAGAGQNSDALALWRGPPLVDLREERFADDARRRLDELRLAALEGRIDDDLAHGRSAQVIPELEDLVREHPLREQLRAQLMRALYGAGRQGDALETYRNARRTLREELGLDPGPELQQLERKILQQDPALASPQTPPSQPSTPARRRRRRVFALAAALLIAGAAVAIVYATAGGTDTPIVATKNSLAVIDPGKNRVVDVVPIGATPRGIAVGKSHVWTANAGEGTVTEVDPVGPSVVQTIGIGTAATDLVEAAGQLWVVTGSDNTLVRVDARSGGVLGSTKISPDPTASAYAIAASPGAVWVASGDTVYKINPVTEQPVARRRHVGAGINDIAVHAGSVWLATSVEVIFRLATSDLRYRGETNLGEISVSLAIARGSVWAAGSSPHGPTAALWRLDEQTARVTQTVQLGASGFPPSAQVAYGEGSIWVATWDDGNVVRVNPENGAILSRIHVGGHPWGIAVGHGKVWVTVS